MTKSTGAVWNVDANAVAVNAVAVNDVAVNDVAANDVDVGATVPIPYDT